MSARVLIVDDEPLARRVLRGLFAPLDDFEVVGESRDGVEALAAITRLRPDVLFLDVQMPELDGVALVRALAALDLDRAPALVFVTAYDEFATRAFEAAAIDYLVKPFTDARFLATIERVRHHLAREAVFERHGAEPAARLVVTVGGRSLVVRVDDVEWVSADGYCARLHVGATSYLVRASLDALEQRLGAGRFVRVHRGALVRLDRVRELRNGGGRRTEVVLASGARVPVSERRRAALTRRLGDR